MTDALTQARERVAFAKRQFTEAAKACQRADPDAPAQADSALAELNRAQAALRRLTAPAPQGSWAIARINQECNLDKD